MTQPINDEVAHDNATKVKRLEARTSIIGKDTTIRRALPHRELRMVGAWCFLDHAGPVQFPPDNGMHVGPHPHIGLQTFTWMIDGEIMHRDSLGYQQIIKPGQVNLMTAGRGIVHSEDSVSHGGRLHAAQLWIALPDAERYRGPDFKNYAQLPVILQDGFTITLLAGSALGHTSPAQVFTPLVGLDITASAAADTQLPLDPHFEYAALVLEGSVSLVDETLTPGTLLYLGTGHTTLSLQTSKPARVLLLGGEPFGEPILLWWNFVARTQAELEQALADWNSGDLRFGRVPGAITAPLQAPTLDNMKLKAT